MPSAKMIRAALRTALELANMAGKTPGVEVRDGKLLVVPAIAAPFVGREVKGLKRYLDTLAVLALAVKTYERHGAVEHAVYVIDFERAKMAASNMGIIDIEADAGKAETATASNVERIVRMIADAVAERLLAELKRALPATVPGVEFEELRRENERLARRVKELERRLAEAQKVASPGVVKEAERLRKEVTRLRKRVRELEEEREELLEELDKLRGAGDPRELKKRVVLLEAELRQLRRENEELKSRLRSIEKENIELRRMLGIIPRRPAGEAQEDTE